MSFKYSDIEREKAERFKKNLVCLFRKLIIGCFLKLTSLKQKKTADIFRQSQTDFLQTLYNFFFPSISEFIEIHKYII